MKRRDLESHLHRNGCEVVREGGGHTVYRNAANAMISTVPRHNEIKLGTVRGICRTLDIPLPPFR
jgi:mRNA interferase HicA